jgi:hypothetical protein
LIQSQRRRRLQLHRLVHSLALGAFLAAGHAQATTSYAPSAAPGAAGVWAFSITAPNGEQSTLMGSMHVADRHLRQPDPRLVRDARTVVFEHPGLGTGTVASTPWRKAVSPADIDALRLHLSCKLPFPDEKLVNNVVAVILAQSTPLEATQLAYDGCDSVGYEARDVIIHQAQVRYQIPLRYLETDEAVGALEKRNPTDASGREVHFALSGDAAILKADVVDALNNGDYAKVDAVTAKSIVAVGLRYGPFYDRMVRQRNENWMQTLPPLLNTGGAFILIGAGHLPGKHGLIALLRTRGYIVQPVQLPAGQGTTAETYRTYAKRIGTDGFLSSRRRKSSSISCLTW